MFKNQSREKEKKAKIGREAKQKKRLSVLRSFRVQIVHYVKVWLLYCLWNIFIGEK